MEPQIGTNLPGRTIDIVHAAAQQAGLTLDSFHPIVLGIVVAVCGASPVVCYYVDRALNRPGVHDATPLPDPLLAADGPREPEQQQTPMSGVPFRVHVECRSCGDDGLIAECPRCGRVPALGGAA